jgi:predicted outer membrane protein
VVVAPIDEVLAQAGSDRQTPDQDRRAPAPERKAPGPSQTPSRDNQQTGSIHEDGFLPHLLQMNASEAELGNLAATRGQSVRVKNFGQMIARVHSDTVQGLGGLFYVGGPKAASTANRAATGPNRADYSAYLGKDHQQTMDRLRGLSGAAFDREIMNTLVTRHQDALKYLETHANHFRGMNSKASAGRSNQNDYRADWVRLSERLIPVVKDHLQQAQTIQREVQGGTPRTN